MFEGIVDTMDRRGYVNKRGFNLITRQAFRGLKSNLRPKNMELMRLFIESDADGDGALTPDEWDAFKTRIEKFVSPLDVVRLEEAKKDLLDEKSQLVSSQEHQSLRSLRARSVKKLKRDDDIDDRCMEPGANLRTTIADLLARDGVSKRGGQSKNGGVSFEVDIDTDPSGAYAGDRSMRELQNSMVGFQSQSHRRLCSELKKVNPFGTPITESGLISADQLKKFDISATTDLVALVTKLQDSRKENHVVEFGDASNRHRLCAVGNGMLQYTHKAHTQTTPSRTSTHAHAWTHVHMLFHRYAYTLAHLHKH